MLTRFRGPLFVTSKESLRTFLFVDILDDLPETLRLVSFLYLKSITAERKETELLCFTCILVLMT